MYVCKMYVVYDIYVWCMCDAGRVCGVCVVSVCVVCVLCVVWHVRGGGSI